MYLKIVKLLFLVMTALSPLTAMEDRSNLLAAKISKIENRTVELNREHNSDLTALMCALLLPEYHPYIKHFVDDTINNESHNGCTALMLAVELNLVDIVSLLVDHGAKILLQNKIGKNAFDYAIMRNNSKIIEIFRSKLTSENQALEHGKTAIAQFEMVDGMVEEPDTTDEDLELSGYDNNMSVFKVNYDDERRNTNALFNSSSASAKITQNTHHSEQTIGTIASMETDQFEATQEESECEFDSDREFTVNESSFRDERNDELDYSSDAEFTVNTASFDHTEDIAFSYGNDSEESEEIEIENGDKQKDGRERSYKCKKRECDKAYYHKRSLKRHNQAVHKNKKPHKCNFKGCDFKTAYNADLVRHLRIHNGDRRYICMSKDCGQRFYRKEHLANHKRSHNHEKAHTCDECHKKYSQIAHLITHQKAKHQNAIYTCNRDGCEFATSYSGALKRHEAIHTGQKPFGCACGYKTSQKSHLTRHQKSCLQEK